MASSSTVPLTSSEWQQKSLVAVLLSVVIFPGGWDCWPEDGKSRAPGDALALAASLCQTVSLLIIPGTVKVGAPDGCAEPAWISHAPIPGTLPRHRALKNPVRNPQHSVSLFVFSFSEVLAFHNHSRSLLGIFRSSTAASGAKFLLCSPFCR